MHPVRGTIVGLGDPKELDGRDGKGGLNETRLDSRDVRLILTDLYWREDTRLRSSSDQANT